MPDSLVMPRRSDADRIMRAVKRVEALGPVQPPRETAEEFRRESVPIYNSHLGAIPANAIVWLDKVHTDGVSHVASQPPFSSIEKYGIACTPILQGRTGRAWVTGTRRITITLKFGETLEPGDAVCPRRHSWTAQKFALGPMLVKRVISQTGATVVADVRLDVWRGDEIYVRNHNDTVYGPFRARRWGQDYTLSVPFPGQVLVTKD